MAFFGWGFPQVENSFGRVVGVRGRLDSVGREGRGVRLGTWVGAGLVVAVLGVTEGSGFVGWGFGAVGTAVGTGAEGTAPIGATP